MGTAITPLESYELTGFLRIYATTFGIVLKFHDFIPSCSHSRISQILCIKLIVEVRTIVTACFDHQNYARYYYPAYCNDQFPWRQSWPRGRQTWAQPLGWPLSHWVC